MRNKLTNIFIFLLFVSSVSLQAQHFPIYSQYMLNGLSINPAYAGSRDVLSIAAMYRNQWVGFKGAPITSELSAHMPLKNKSTAIGLSFVNEKIGYNNNISTYGHYAYRFDNNKGFSLGLKAGFDLLKVDNSSVLTKNTDDIIALSDAKSHLMPNAGVGAYYYNSKFFAGVSVPRLLSYKKSTSAEYTPYNDFKNYNYLITSGALVKVNESFKIKPSFLIRYQANSPFLYDLNLNAILFKNDLLWIGTSYRKDDAIVGIIEYQINTQMRLGYSYDYSIGSFSNYNSGSHEIVLRYEFRYIVNAVNPKYF